jgi:hypothetical protein
MLYYSVTKSVMNPELSLVNRMRRCDSVVVRWIFYGNDGRPKNCILLYYNPGRTDEMKNVWNDQDGVCNWLKTR